jgi:hypothetical protein
MRKIFLYAFIILNLISISLTAQVRRIVLMEVVTNSGCGNCAVSNEIMNRFYENYFGGVISVRYHASWPDISDPMFQADSVDNNARTDYYGVTYTPQYFMDGVSKGAAEDEERMFREMNNDLIKKAPVWIDIDADITADSVKFNVIITAYENIDSGNLRLRTAIVERLKQFTVPPGANGEKDFPDVMRKMLPDFNGIDFPSMQRGNSATYSFTCAVNPIWNWKDLAVVAWIQDDNTKNIIQSNINIPTVIIEPEQDDFLVVQQNQTITNYFKIKNQNNKPVSVLLNSKTNPLINGWSFDFDSLGITIATHDSLLFTASVSTDTNSSMLSAQLIVKNINDYLPYHFKNSFIAASQEQPLVIINKNKTTILTERISPVLDSLNLDYSVIGSFETKHWINRFAQLNISSGMLFSEDSYPSYTKSDIVFLISLLDSGKPVLVSGENISASRSDFAEARTFYDDYLDAQFVSIDSADFVYSTVDNPVITLGTFNLSGYYTPAPEVITSRTGNSIPILTLNSSYEGVVGLANSTSSMTIYLGFGIGQVDDFYSRKELIREIFTWFGILRPVGISDISEAVPNRFLLEQNYPNPFSAKEGYTSISFFVPDNNNEVGYSTKIISSKNNNSGTTSNISLKVYNLLGQEVQTLVNKKLQPGNYSVQFSSNNLPSGIYFYRLVSGKNKITRKMILIR